MEILVDEQDRHLLDAHNWRVYQFGGYIWYAQARHNGRNIFLHRVIMGEPKGLEVDHRNGNGLDNRRCNLRLATPSQNKANQRLSRGNTSGFKGVTRNHNRWMAQVKHERQRVYIGTFGTPEEAARAYDAKALELFGEFANTNAMLGLL